jgi:hypothetical protein
LISVSSELPVTVKKTAGTIYRAAGREHQLFGRLEAEKVASPPSLSPPARFGAFSTVIFVCISSLSPTLQ